MAGTVQQELTRIIQTMRDDGVSTVWLASDNVEAIKHPVPAQSFQPIRQAPQPAPVSSPAQHVYVAPQPVPQPAPAAPPPKAQDFPADFAERVKAASWDDLEALMKSGAYAPQSSVGQFLFFAGNRKPKVVFVGESPFAEESASGKPFSGQDGEMLYKMGAAMKLNWGEGEHGAAVVNVMKYRPLAPPQPQVIERCALCLKRQLQLLSPALLVLLGNLPMKVLTSASGFSQMKGKWLDYNGLSAMLIQNPAQIVRMANMQQMFVAERRQAWASLQEVMKHPLFG